MAKANDMQILVDINKEDIDNGTQHLKMSPHFVSGNIRGKNGYVEMGVEPSNVLALFNDEAMAILVIIDKETYRRHRALAEAKGE